MADAFENVVLKIALQVENNRLERIDTRAAEESIKQFYATAKAEHNKFAEGLAAQMAADLSAAGRSRSVGGGGHRGGSPGGGDVGGGGGEGMISRRTAGYEDQERRIAALANATARTAGVQKQFNDSIGQTFLYMQRTSGEVERMVAAQSSYNKASSLSIPINNNIGQSLSKIGTTAAALSVGYRVLTEVNGQHINVLGQYEGAILKASDATAVLGHVGGGLVSVLAKMGVTVGGAVTAAMVALPVAVYAGLKAVQRHYESESERFTRVDAQTQEKLLAIEDARREKSKAAEQRHVDEMISVRRKLSEASAERFGRMYDTANRQAGLTSDPSRRLSELQQIQKQLEAESANSRTLGRNTNATPEQRKQFAQEEAAFQERINTNLEAQRDAQKEITAQKKQYLDILYQARTSEEEQAKRLQSMSPLERARESLKGGPDEIGPRERRELKETEDWLAKHDFSPQQLGSAASIDAEMAKLEAEAKARDEQFISSLKESAGRQGQLQDSMQTLMIQYEATAEATEKFVERVEEIEKMKETRLDAAEKKLQEIGGASTRRTSSSFQ